MVSRAHKSLIPNYRLVSLGISLVLLAAACSNQGLRQSQAPQEEVAGVKDPVINLNGTWKFSLSPPPDFWSNEVLPSDWPKIDVPGECLMQGFRIQHNIASAYKKRIDIPKDYAGKRILLRFDGVYSYARVWVNGRFIRDHHGGFTSWDCDITDAASPGAPAWITVEVTDRDDDISYGSGYAHHLIGGILRDVFLLALPKDRIAFLHVETDWDAAYQDAILKIAAGAVFESAERGRLRFSLFDKNGKSIHLDRPRLELAKSRSAGEIRWTVKTPLPWDAEHPNLYTLIARLEAGGNTVQVFRQKVGFRKVEFSGNKLLVNGRPVKLRGACRHDVHPLLGRRSTRELDRQDVLLAKEANINFIRTSHYPPSRSFLEFCDEYGVYVEEETAVCFVGTHRSPEYHKVSFTQDDPAFTDRYLGQLREMVDRDRNHPSVIIWSIGNENLYGSNFEKEFDWVKLADPTRPVMFSYPGKVPKGGRGYDIQSMHYPSYEGNLDQYGIVAKSFACGDKPVIFDEWAHVPCYNTETLLDDPNVRNFWGESLKRFWDKTFESEAVGGAIWGMIDDVFLLPDGAAGYGEWGIIDGWRRRKPEFWHTKKAYSPVRVLETTVGGAVAGQPLVIHVFNRFDHTSLDDLRLRWTWLGKPDILTPPAIPPHSRGEISLPARNWKAGDIVLIQFYRGRRFIDEELITLSPAVEKKPKRPARKTEQLAVEKSPDGWRVSGAGFCYLISRRTGLIQEVRAGSSALIEAGPYLYLKTLKGQSAWNRFEFFETDPKSWRLEKTELDATSPGVTVRTSGRINNLRYRLQYTVESNGALTVDFDLEDLPEGRPAGLGVSFDLKEPAWLEWQRDALWTVYPEGHIGRPTGSALLGTSAMEAYREEPKAGWNTDVWDFFLQGLNPPSETSRLLSNDARSLKENIRRYVIGFENSPSRLSVEAAGDQAVRVKAESDGRFRLVILTAWDYPDIDWGNYTKPFKLTDHRRGRIRLRLD